MSHILTRIRQLWRARKIILRAGPELKFENYESVQHSLQFSGIKKGAKISFHRHFKHDVYGKRQTAKMKLLLSVFSSLYSTIKIFVFAVNSERHVSIFV